jgi:hypothetical protein
MIDFQFMLWSGEKWMKADFDVEAMSGFSHITKISTTDFPTSKHVPGQHTPMRLFVCLFLGQLVNTIPSLGGCNQDFSMGNWLLKSKICENLISDQTGLILLAVILVLIVLEFGS